MKDHVSSGEKERKSERRERERERGINTQRVEEDRM